MARRSPSGGGAARAHHAGVPQPFVDALAVRRSAGTRGYAVPCCASSCSFSAASLANGEFGSGCLVARGSWLDSTRAARRVASLKSRSRSRRGGRAAALARPGRPPPCAIRRGAPGGRSRRSALARRPVALLAVVAPAMARPARAARGVPDRLFGGVASAPGACSGAAATSAAGAPAALRRWTLRTARGGRGARAWRRTPFLGRTAGPPDLDHLGLGARGGCCFRRHGSAASLGRGVGGRRLATGAGSAACGLFSRGRIGRRVGRLPAAASARGDRLGFRRRQRRRVLGFGWRLDRRLGGLAWCNRLPLQPRLPAQPAPLRR